ncbi:MAG: thioredoxin domain-containing protein [Actinobacteria bacterium]|nr:thioredoxin domain-containing protein [Actinomycetota bacterium]
MPNRLVNATSPYLRQHADNPVDWFEWGPDAFALARERDVPILLSIGYAACHWCHVMAHESFEDDTTARFMNEHFVSIKVDREERPDIDGIYMEALQAMRGQGGWPLTAFLDSEGRPFFAGTYFPPTDRHGHPSFMRVLDSIHRLWVDDRTSVFDRAERLVKSLRVATPTEPFTVNAESAEHAMRALTSQFDTVHGGFGHAPKFPQAPLLELLAAIASRHTDEIGDQATHMLSTSLHAMAAGGIYDHIDGGFARYSVDEKWLIPHFEKMLYDNALLATAYLRGWQITGDNTFRRVACETLDYLLNDLRDSQGALWSSEDADAEGIEGKFAVWTMEELEILLTPEEVVLAGEWFGVSAGGNFEGSNHLFLPNGMPAQDPAAVQDMKEKLRNARNDRVRPGVDDKIVTEWNGLAISALAEVGSAFGVDRYIAAAREIDQFITSKLMVDGVLHRSGRADATSGPGFAEDYGAYACGLFSLGVATHDPTYAQRGITLVDDLIDRFADQNAGVFRTAHDAEQLITRQKPLFDNPTPSPQTLALKALTIAHALTGDERYRGARSGIWASLGPMVQSYPTAIAGALAVGIGFGNETAQLAIVGTDDAVDKMVAAVLGRFRPWIVTGASSSVSDLPLFADRPPPPESAQAFLCHDFVCDLPVSDTDDLIRVLEASLPKASG